MPSFVNEIGVRAVVYNVAGLTGAMGQIRREAALTSGSLVGLGAASRRQLSSFQSLGLAVTQFGNNIRILGSQIANLGLRSTLFVTLPFAAALYSSATAAAEFETQMVKIENITEATTATTKRWTQEILRLAPELGQLPTELAAQQYFIASVGITNTKDAMAALGVTAKLVAAGLGESEDVTRAIVASMSEFGLSAEESGDIFLQTVREGAAEADTLAGTLGRVLAIAREVGLSFEEVGAFVSIYTRSGVTAEVATTALRSALSRFLKPTQQTIDVLAEYKLTVDDVLRSIRDPNVGFARTLIGLRQLFGDNDQAMSQLIGTQRGLAGVLSVTGEQADEYLRVLERIKNSGGELDIVFERVSQTFQFQWNAMLAAAQAAAIRIGNVILPILLSVVQGIRGIITTVADLAEEFPQLTRVAFIFGAIAAAAGPVIFILGSLVASFGSLIVFVGNVIALGGALIAGFFSPVGAAALALAPIVLGLFAAFGTTAAVKIRETFTEAGATVDDIAAAAAQWGANIIISLANGMAQAATYVINTVISIMNAVATLLRAQSPPKALPHLTEWGEAAMLAWLEGWTNVDIFNTFRDITSIITQAIRSTGRAQGAEPEAILETIFGSRQAIAQIFKDFLATDMSAEDFLFASSGLQHLIQALGGPGAEGSQSDLISNLVVDMLALARANEDVADAQENLNQVQANYSAILDPLRERLAGIRSQQEATARADRRSFLQSVLTDPRSTEEVRKRARLELEELSILDQIARVERQEDAAVSAAQAQLDAAIAIRDAIAEQVEEQRALVDILEEEKSLFGELAQILASIAEDITAAIDSATGGGGAEVPGGGGGEIPEVGGGGGIGALGGLDPRRLEQLRRRLERNSDDPPPTLFDTLIDSIRTGTEDSIAELEAAAVSLPAAFDNLLTAVEEKKPSVEKLAGIFAGALATALINAIGTALLGKREEFVQLLLDFFDPSKQLIDAGGPTAFGAGLAEALGPELEKLGQFLSTKISELVSGIGEGVLSIVADVQLRVGRLAIQIGTIIDLLLTKFSEWLDDMIEAGRTKAEELWAAIVEWFTNLYNDLIGESIVPDIVNGIIDEFARLITEAPAKIGEAVGNIIDKFVSLLFDLIGPGGVIPNIISGIVEWFRGLGGSIVGAIQEWVGGEGSPVATMIAIGADMLAGITAAISNFGWVSWLVGIVTNALRAARDTIVRWFNNFVLTLGGDNDGGGTNDGGGDTPVAPIVFGVPTNPFGTNQVNALPIVAGSGGTAIQINMNGISVRSSSDIDAIAMAVERRLMRSLR